MNLKFYLRGLGIGIVVTAIIMLVISSKAGKTLSDEEIKQRAQKLGMVEENTTLSALADGGEASSSELDNATPVAEESLNTEAVGENVQTEETVANTAATDETEQANGDRLDEIEQVLDEADAYLDGDSKVSSPEATSEPTEVPTKEPTKEPTATPAPTEVPTKAPTATPVPTKMPEATGNTVSDGKSFTISSGQDSYTIAKNLQSAGLISDASSFDTYLCQSGLDRKLKAGSYVISEGSSEDEIARIIAK